MCRYTHETLAPRLLAEITRAPGLTAQRLYEPLQRAGEVCLVHFDGAVRLLLRRRHVRPLIGEALPESSVDEIFSLPLGPGSASPPETGSRLVGGRFSIDLSQLPLGIGATSRVYRAIHVHLDRPVALKVLSLDLVSGGTVDPSVVERFLREGRIAARLNHPNIVQVFDSGRDGQDLWYAMELMEGGTLASRILREGRLEPASVLEYGRKVATALAAALDQSILHRDVKPDNIFVSGIKIADFGFAKIRTLDAGDPLTSPGTIIGTPPYLSPEQAAGREVDHRSDLYSLGATLYHAASGRHLFDLPPQAPLSRWVSAHISEEPVPLPQMVRGFPEGLARIIARCLDKMPERRYPTYRDLIADLNREAVRLPRVARRIPAAEPAHPAEAPRDLAARLEADMRRVSARYEAMYGAGCWSVHPAFQRALWDLARQHAVTADCARILGVRDRKDFEEALDVALTVFEEGQNPLSDVPIDLRDYVWLAIRPATRGDSAVAPDALEPALRLTRFLDTFENDSTLAPFRLPARVPEPGVEALLAGSAPTRTDSAGRQDVQRALRVVRPADVEKAATNPANRLGQFILVGEVGRGGMGRVYRAWDDHIGRQVAVKVLHGTQPEAMSRFFREARMAARLRHPAIASVYDMGVEGERGYIAMQFIDGAPADAAAPSLRRKLEIVRDAARALQYAHDQGVVHRDVKPGNLLVDREGAVFVTDFGVAKDVRAEGDAKFSVTGAIIGTPEYMSPEQARGDRAAVGPTSDVYGLAATLYGLIARRAPFQGKNVGQLLMAVMERPPEPLTRLDPEVSPALDEFVARAMSKNPQDRPASAAALADEIEALLSSGGFTGARGLAGRLARRWVPVLAAGILAAVLVRWMVPALLVPATRRGPVDLEALYAAASLRLAAIERDGPSLGPAERRERIGREVLPRIDDLLSADPAWLPAKVLKVRALVVDGRRAEAGEALAALAGQERRDYRIGYFRSLLELEVAVARPPPLPALEAPRPEWESPPECWPEILTDGIRAVPAASPAPRDRDEHRRDAATARRLAPLLDGDWDLAARTLAETPAFRAAWRRAAYLARRFAELRAHPDTVGTPERLGAEIALALEGGRSRPALEEILPRCPEGSPEATMVRIALARELVREGFDPAPMVAAAAESVARDRERLGVLRAAELRWLRLSARDLPERYREACALLGDDPVSWVARVALAELRSAAAASGSPEPGSPAMALEWTDRLASLAPGWAVPRRLRGLVLVHSGRPIDAWAQLQPLVERDDPDLESVGAAALCWLRISEDSRRSGRPDPQALRRAREYARRVLDLAPGHPEALEVEAAALVRQAEDRLGAGEDPARELEAALAASTSALGRAPGYVSARVRKAAAHFLLAETGAIPARPPGADLSAAREELDAALGASPSMGAARCLRGIVLFAMGRREEAAADWSLLKDDPEWRGGELDSWIRDAKRRSP